MLGPRTLIESVADEARALRVEPEVCARSKMVAGHRSDCVACVEICPVQAIALDPVQVDDSRCDGCGACTAACPTQALAPGSSAVRDAFRLLASRPEARVTIACLEARRLEEAALTLPCLASLPWELPVALLARGASEVELRMGACDRCAHSALADRVETQCSAIERAVQALGLPGIERATAGNEGGSGPQQTRRGLFRGLLRRGQNVAERAGAATVDRVVQAITDQEVADLDPLWLRKLLARSLAAREAVAPKSVELPNAAAPTVSEACVPCPLCAASCPTDALTFRDDGEGLRLELVPELCTDCGACDGVCPKGALELEPHLSLGEWGKSRTLASSKPGACASCGEPALSPELPYCARCYREGRALRPTAIADSED